MYRDLLMARASQISLILWQSNACTSFNYLFIYMFVTNLYIPHYNRLGVNILKSKPLRSYASYLSYTDQRLATDDALRIGALHCNSPSWERASINFLKSGGFVISDKVPRVSQDTLVVWGRDDRVLEPSTAARFKSTLPKCTLTWIEECGHVPHLEKPVDTTKSIVEFLNGFDTL